ncbi:MAG: twin-arginine translocation signal domain-containing protein [Slackia sp.]
MLSAMNGRRKRTVAIRSGQGGEMSDKEMGFSRRNFLKGAALTGAAMAGAATLAGCAGGSVHPPTGCPRSGITKPISWSSATAAQACGRR